MPTVFVLKNQQTLFWNRQGEWVSGTEASSLFRSQHKDEAINVVFEISARDYAQRVEIVAVETTEKGVPIIPPEWIVEWPEPQPEQALQDEIAESVEDGVSPSGEDIASPSGADEASAETGMGQDQPIAGGETDGGEVGECAESAESSAETESRQSLDFFQEESA